MPRADWATNESAITDTRARSPRACSSEMSITCSRPHSGASIARAHRECVRLGGRQPGIERAVHEQAPDLLEGHLADEVLDVDTAVAQGAALFVGLRYRRPKGDYSLEAGGSFDYLGHGL